jgi:hypothetical protein
MSVDATSTPHSFHMPAPKAPDVSKGKFADSPAFAARAGGPAADTPFGQMVAEIARQKQGPQS